MRTSHFGKYSNVLWLQVDEVVVKPRIQLTGDVRFMYEFVSLYRSASKH